MCAFQETQKETKATDRDNLRESGQLNLLELHEQNHNLNLSKSNLVGSGESAVMTLDAYLERRDRRTENQSYFRAGTTSLLRMGRHLIGADDAVAKFDEARKQGNFAAMLSLQQADRAQRILETRVGAYSAAALKTAFLFTGGKAGWAGLTAVATADEAKPADDFSKQATDAALGAAKGLATRFVFNKINEQPWNPVAKGWTMGMSQRFIDVGLSSNTYLDEHGNVDLKAGGLKTLSSVFGPQALMVDAGTGLTSSLLIPVNYYTGGEFFKNAALAKLTIAGVSGLTEGSLHELNRQQDRPTQPPIVWKDVAVKGAQRAAINTISALPSSGLIKIGK